MRRFALVIAATLAVAGIFSAPASAGKGWCRSDPTVSLNGVQIQFVVSIPIESQADVIGPVEVAMVAPQSVDMTLVYADSGFNGYGESVNLVSNGKEVAEDGSFNVAARISVPMRGNTYVDMLVDVIPESGDSAQAQGYTVGVKLITHVTGTTISVATKDQVDTTTSSTTSSIQSSTENVETSPVATAATADTVAPEPTVVEQAPAPTETPVVTEEATQPASDTTSDAPVVTEEAVQPTSDAASDVTVEIVESPTVVPTTDTSVST